ncbi:MAG: GNAT family N-acetyltransferase [Bifidobacteriaceae bacterium]|nr:GNAT family N-acetyltransferase [Bifidobacteriaceae bacterium]MCI1979491.1 GNAT family N-acetyltransferase [Bifidobacteriaceae bacterium]
MAMMRWRGLKMESLETDRLILRPWRTDNEREARVLFKYASDPGIGPLAGWPPHTSVAGSARDIKNILSADESYAITLKGVDEPIGSISLKPIDGHVTSAITGDPGISEQYSPLLTSAKEVGYWVGRPFWGKGLATEALKALISHAFLDLRIAHLWGVHYDDNAASAAVMQKCGFRIVCRYENAYYPLIDEHHTIVIRLLSHQE